MEASAGLLQVFLVFGGSILAGYVGHLLFERYRVSDILFMLGLGVLAGPLMGLVDPAALAPAFAVLAPLALALVLFEGGLELAWVDVRRTAGRALAFTLTVWTLTVCAVAVTAHLWLGLPLVLAFLFGVAVAATGILGVIPLLAQMRPPADARVVLTFETSVGDLLSAIATTVIAGILLLGGTPWVGAGIFGAKFAVGAAVGLLAGIVWARVLAHVKKGAHSFALTLGALLVMYVIAETLHGSGFLAALTFGLVLGNAGVLVRDGGFRFLAAPAPDVRLHQSELIFILRSVYFVYIGAAVSSTLFAPRFLLAAFGITLAMIAARALGTWMTTRGWRPARGDTRLLLAGVMPRGLAAALIAGVPHAMGLPGTEMFLGYAFLVIVGTDIATSITVFVYERRKRGVASPAGADAEMAQQRPT